MAANICFDCQNACGGCSWSARFEPVPGWTAEKVQRKITCGWYSFTRDGYSITACPQFVKDKPRKIKRNSGELTLEQIRGMLARGRL